MAQINCYHGFTTEHLSQHCLALSHGMIIKRGESIMENIKKYYGADASDEVLPWIFYRMIESEHSKGIDEIEIVFEIPEQSFGREVITHSEVSKND